MAVGQVPEGTTQAAVDLVKRMEMSDGKVGVSKADAARTITAALKQGITQTQIDIALTHGKFYDLGGAKAAIPVMEAQTQLQLCGGDLGKSGADGSIGPATTSAIIKFQKEHKLKPTGKLDDATKAALQTESAKVGKDDRAWATAEAGKLRKDLTASCKGKSVDKLMAMDYETLRKAEDRGDIPPGATNKLMSLRGLEKGLKASEGTHPPASAFVRLHEMRAASSFGVIGVLSELPKP